jgi:hypothetical protein
MLNTPLSKPSRFHPPKMRSNYFKYLQKCRTLKVANKGYFGQKLRKLLDLTVWSGQTHLKLIGLSADMDYLIVPNFIPIWT